MTFSQFISFALSSLLLIITPGPDNLSVVSYGLSRGRRAGMLFGAGCATGCLLHTLWLCLGLSVLMAASPAAFTCLKIAGALYLFYLAFRAFRSGGLINLKEVAGVDTTLSATVYFRRGFLANALNPKVALFFLAFLPQFTRPGAWSIPTQFLALGLLFALLSLVIFVSLGACSGAVGAFLKGHTHLGAWLDRLTGIVFVGLGVWILFTQAKPRPH
jgi:threonine/homoserine/homoserine lactone efflux protein